MPQSLYEWIWIFLIYAFLGWAVEEVFHAVKSGKFVNRGFLNGPWCPIYGFGMILVIVFLFPLRNNLLVLFAGSFVLTTLLELVTGFVLNHLFHSRWWDYSDKPFQLGGYICLEFSIYWGLAGTFVVALVHETIYRLVTVIPKTVGLILEAVLVAAFAADCVLTLFTVLKLTGRIRVLDDLSKGLRQISDDIGEKLYEDTENVSGMLSSAGAVFKDDVEEKKEEHEEKRQRRRQRLDALQVWKTDHRTKWEELSQKYKSASSREVFGARRLLKAFPNVKFTDRNEMLQKYKKQLLNQGEENGKSET